MIHPQDQESFDRFGISPVPEELEAEYELRLRWFHADGHSGPLGTVSLIALIRGMGIGKAMAPEVPKQVEWRDQTYTARVGVNTTEGLKTGTFVGMVQAGTLAVRIDDTGATIEVPKRFVGLLNSHGNLVGDYPAIDSSEVPGAFKDDCPFVPDPPKVDWSQVAEGDRICFDDPGHEIEYVSFVSVGTRDQTGDPITLNILADQVGANVRSVPARKCSLIKNNQHVTR
jgi:hypothetical protein